MYVKTRLGRWFYEERGRGTPIVLWHSLLCDGEMWRAQVGPLSEIGRVVVFDGPGHGRSEGAPPFDLWENVEAAVDALGALGIERAIWCGLSWGGMLGMRLAIAHPERVRALALLDTQAGRDGRAKRVKYTLLVQFSRVAGIPEKVWDRAIAPIMFGARALRERPELSKHQYRRTAGFPVDALARTSMAVVVSRDDVTDKVGQIRAPTLVIHGEDDRAIPLERGRELASRIPGARLEIVPGAGHLSTMEAPARVNAALVPFVRAHA